MGNYQGTRIQDAEFALPCRKEPYKPTKKDIFFLHSFLLDPHLYLILARDRAAVLHIRTRLLAVHAAHGVVGGGGVHLVEAAAAEGALGVELGRVVRVLPTLKNGKIKKKFL